LAQNLDALEMTRDNKAENYCLYIKQQSHDLEAVIDEIERLQTMKKSLVNKIDFGKSWIASIMGPEWKAKTPQFTARMQNFPISEFDEAKLPEKFWRIIQTREVDKVELKTALKSGEQIVGAKLVDNFKLILK